MRTATLTPISNIFGSSSVRKFHKLSTMAISETPSIPNIGTAVYHTVRRALNRKMLTVKETNDRNKIRNEIKGQQGIPDS